MKPPIEYRPSRHPHTRNVTKPVTPTASVTKNVTILPGDTCPMCALCDARTSAQRKQASRAKAKS